jgi:hypothetical protein
VSAIPKNEVIDGREPQRGKDVSHSHIRIGFHDGIGVGFPKPCRLIDEYVVALGTIVVRSLMFVEDGGGEERSYLSAAKMAIHQEFTVIV